MADRRRRAEATAARESPSCVLKRLPDHLREDAAASAVAINLANRVNTAHGVAAMLPRAEIAALTTKMWPSTGVELAVKFDSLFDAATRRQILEYANHWNDGSKGCRANVKFRETNGNGDVRVSKDNTGYWSYLGTDIRHIPANQATLNLQGFSAKTPASEYARVVEHEFGHTLGFPHEHMRAAIIARLDPEKVIAYFRQTQNWSRQEVIAQILSPLDPSELSPVSSPEDESSVMAYQFPASLTKDGRAIPGGNGINATDAKTVELFYPPAGGPTVPGGGPKPWVISGSSIVTCGNCGAKANIVPTVQG